MFSLYGIALLVLAVAGLYIYGRRNPNTIVGRFVGAGRAQVNDLSHKAKDADPLANRQQIIDDATTEVREHAGNVAEYKASLDEAILQVDGLVNEVATLELNIKKRAERIQELTLAGQGDGEEVKRIKTGGYVKATELAQKKALLAQARSNVERYQKSFDGATEKLRKANSRVEQAKATQRTLGAELKMSEFDAAMADAQGKLVGSDTALGSLDEATAAVRRQISANKAKAEVVSLIDEQDDFDKQFEVSPEEAAGRDLFESMLQQNASVPSAPPAKE